jgi:hypothetical protein
MSEGAASIKPIKRKRRTGFPIRRDRRQDVEVPRYSF